MYEYRATVTNVVDGDTLDVTIDLGFRVTITMRVRLFGIDAYELNSPDAEARELAIKAKAYVMARVQDKAILLQSYKPYPTDKYGRYLASVMYYREDAVGTQDLNVELVTLGLAKTYP